MSATNWKEVYRVQTARIAELEASLNAVIAANERAAEQWRAAHPGKDLVIPDQAAMVEWLLEQNAALKAALDHQMTYQRELRADRDRLDWLQEMKLTILHHDGNVFGRGLKSPSVRAAIDAAMGEGKQ